MDLLSRTNVRQIVRVTKWPQLSFLHPCHRQHLGPETTCEGRQQTAGKTRAGSQETWDESPSGTFLLASVFFICKGNGWIPAHSNSNFLLFLQSETGCVTSFGFNQRNDCLTAGRNQKLNPWVWTPLPTCCSPPPPPVSDDHKA